ncbi:MAG: hypothetical protein WAU86_04370 [Oricola sp.]
MSIDDVLARTEVLIGSSDADLERDAVAIAAELLAMGEAVLVSWHTAKGAEPTGEKTEGFRLLALHRQGARGNPSFNACRETCREVVYHHNLVLHDPLAPDTARTVRLGAMVVRHLALFVGGKLQEDGLGDFCCSSRPIRQSETSNTVIETV